MRRPARKLSTANSAVESFTSRGKIDLSCSYSCSCSILEFRLRVRAGARGRSHVEPKRHHVAVANFVIFAFDPQLSSLARFCERTKRDQFFVANRFRGD